MRAEKAEGELAAAREQASVLTSIEDQLQARCNTLQSDLTELRENPRIPLEYKQQVERREAEAHAEIARLEEALARLKLENAHLENSNANATEELAIGREA